MWGGAGGGSHKSTLPPAPDVQPFVNIMSKLVCCASIMLSFY